MRPIKLIILIILSLSLVNCSSDEDDQQIIDDLLSQNDPNIYDFSLNRLINASSQNEEWKFDLNENGITDFTLDYDCDYDDVKFFELDDAGDCYDPQYATCEHIIYFAGKECDDQEYGCWCDGDEWGIIIRSLSRGQKINSSLAYYQDGIHTLYAFLPETNPIPPECSGTPRHLGEYTLGEESYLPFQIILEDNLRHNGWLRLKFDCNGIYVYDGAFHLQPGAEILAGQR